MHDVLEVPTDKDIHLADACEGNVKGIVLIIRGEYAPANIFSGQFERFRRQFYPFVRNLKKFLIRALNLLRRLANRGGCQS